MNYHLKKLVNTPLEREYEGWISNEIENYFNYIGVECDVISISPKDEFNFPADLNFFFRGKVIGLQLKRIYSNTNIRDIYWKFSKRQHEYIINHNLPIYYALPTFHNRILKKVSLNHFIFCEANTKFSKDNNSIKYVDQNFSEGITIDNIFQPACRWGKFVEMIFNCEIGKKLVAFDPSTLREIQINKILEEPYGIEIIREIIKSNDIFNFEGKIDSFNKDTIYQSFKEYLKILEDSNKAKIDSSEEEEILLLISIKS